MRKISLPVGYAIPPEKNHGISVSLPTHKSILGYEEQDSTVTSLMVQGYPRFVPSPQFVALQQEYQERYGDDTNYVLPLPSCKTAEACVRYVGAGHVIASDNTIHCAIIPMADQPKAKKFTQHSGQIISSRYADVIRLGTDRATDAEAEAAKCEIKTKLATLTNADSRLDPRHHVAPEDSYLGICGMSSIYVAHEMLLSLNAGKRAIQFGFPYIDTLRILEQFNPHAKDSYIPYNDTSDFEGLERALKDGDIGAIFCEAPSNPLLKTIDFKRLRGIATQYNVTLVIDNTIGTWSNIDIAPYADITVSSLTKFFTGSATVMGGALTLHKNSTFYNQYKHWLDNAFEDLLFANDAVAIAEDCRGYDTRMTTINENALALATYLKDHPLIARIDYPAFTHRAAYDAIKKPHGGYGGLISITMKTPHHGYDLYDALDIFKGPTLGTEFSIACLYTLLAHYSELDWAKASGIDAHLVRISVGKETDLIPRFEHALNTLK